MKFIGKLHRPGVCRIQIRQTPDAKPATGKLRRNMIAMRVHHLFSSRSTASAVLSSELSAGFAASSLSEYQPRQAAKVMQVSLSAKPGNEKGSTCCPGGVYMLLKIRGFFYDLGWWEHG
ncbi:MAG: hypothetical protein HY322_16740 [Betaproteobacteria bacterium]|nr:hypothetical protein [Betaproteobacteria bacterium]